MDHLESFKMTVRFLRSVAAVSSQDAHRLPSPEAARNRCFVKDATSLALWALN